MPVCCVDVLHNVVYPACCGGCAGLLLRPEEKAESLVTQIIFDCVLAGGRGCGRYLSPQCMQGVSGGGNLSAISNANVKEAMLRRLEQGYGNWRGCKCNSRVESCSHTTPAAAVHQALLLLPHLDQLARKACFRNSTSTCSAGEPRSRLVGQHTANAFVTDGG